MINILVSLPVICFIMCKVLSSKGILPDNISTNIIFLSVGILLLYILIKGYFKSEKPIGFRDKIWLSIGIIVGYEFISFSIYDIISSAKDMIL